MSETSYAQAVAIFFLLAVTCSTVIQGQDSSTGPEEGPPSSSSTGMDDTGTNATISSSTGAYNYTNTTNSTTPPLPPPDETRIGFPFYVCGEQVVGAARGKYLDNSTWEDPAWPSYFDCPEWEQKLNTTECPTVLRPRGYDQCYGVYRTSNCFDHFRADRGGKWTEGIFVYDAEANRTIHPYSPANITNFKQGLFCDPADSNRRFTKGEFNGPVCLVFGGGNRLYRAKFYPKTDQFAMITLQDSFGNGTIAHDALGHWGTAFQVEVNGIKSEVKHRYGQIDDPTVKCDEVNGTTIDCHGSSSGSICTVVPFHTIVIKVSQGRVTEVNFDNDCSLCSGDLCVDGNCAQEISKCTAATDYASKTATSGDKATVLTDCDFKVYVSWSGTDADGTYLSSSGRRLSQFRQWSLSAVYNQASNFDIGGNLDIVKRPDDNLG